MWHQKNTQLKKLWVGVVCWCSTHHPGELSVIFSNCVCSVVRRSLSLSLGVLLAIVCFPKSDEKCVNSSQSKQSKSDTMADLAYAKTNNLVAIIHPISGLPMPEQWAFETQKISSSSLSSSSSSSSMMVATPTTPLPRPRPPRRLHHHDSSVTAQPNAPWSPPVQIRVLDGASGFLSFF